MRDRRTVREAPGGRGAAGRAPGRDALPDGRPRAGLRGRGALPRAGADRLDQAVAVLRGPRRGLGRAGRGRDRARQPRGRGPRGRGRGGRGADPRRAPAAADHERGDADRDLQGDRRPARVRRALRAAVAVGHPRARPHADGDREPGHDRGRAPVLDRARPLPRPQRLALEPQRAAPPAAARGDRLPDRERHRGRRGLPRVAAARGRRPAGRARGMPRRPRRLLHVRGRHRRRVRRAARPDRLQARRDGRERRLGRDGVRVPGDRRPPRRRQRRGLGARAGARVLVGARRPRSVAGGEASGRDRRVG